MLKLPPPPRQRWRRNSGPGFSPHLSGLPLSRLLGTLLTSLKVSQPPQLPHEMRDSTQFNRTRPADVWSNMRWARGIKGNGRGQRHKALLQQRPLCMLLMLGPLGRKISVSLPHHLLLQRRDSHYNIHTSSLSTAPCGHLVPGTLSRKAGAGRKGRGYLYTPLIL